MNNNVLDFAKGSRRKRAKEAINIKLYQVTEKELDELADMIEKSSQTVLETSGMYKELASNYESIENSLLDSIKTIKSVAESYKDAYEDAHQAWTRNQDIADILIDIITTNNMEEKIIELVKEEMELERTEDFPCHAEESYNELIHELEHRFDFLKDVK
ncbi:hypothetical protein SAMN04487895_10381 [Paenibacillus sophorae]|uniref:Uncharacterized protein n=1 Tax=Paenibacillus sophorae TaxID=1333845 RepID=A0A1H8JMY3_9BACL|nr:hypothetical protein [Paenibacillus sophorae]QWU13417.1 hypothetical protein KP014_15565 [Paenibacillus sophorae]SEN81905.1 hypothetical protein SAMN04487895_10381 [Paenibacillus sophorae]